MNRNEWALFWQVERGWPIVWIIADFPRAREALVQGQHGGTSLQLPDGRETWYRTTGKGLEAFSTGWIDDPETTKAPRYTETVHLRLTWAQISRWADGLPAPVKRRAVELRREWGAICHERARFWTAGALGPSWHDKYETFGPLTWQAALAVDCDLREQAHHQAERAFCDSLVPDDEPTDLLELLAAM